jgi:hypothetical protein
MSSCAGYCAHGSVLLVLVFGLSKNEGYHFDEETGGP